MINIDAGWLVGLLGALVAFGALRSRGAMKDKAEDAQRRVHAVNESKKVSDEINQKGDDDLHDAAVKWVRDRRR